MLGGVSEDGEETHINDNVTPLRIEDTPETVHTETLELIAFQRYVSPGDRLRLVVDSTDESGAGGTGETHDWTATGTLATRLTTPVVLAGGLTPENVAEAVQTAEPFAVDVSSGVELTPGHKDHNAVARFVANAGREVAIV